MVLQLQAAQKQSVRNCGSHAMMGTKRISQANEPEPARRTVLPYIMMHSTNTRQTGMAPATRWSLPHLSLAATLTRQSRPIRLSCACRPVDASPSAASIRERWSWLAQVVRAGHHGRLAAGQQRATKAGGLGVCCSLQVCVRRSPLGHGL
jgi:hypothetical protein